MSLFYIYDVQFEHNGEFMYSFARTTLKLCVNELTPFLSRGQELEVCAGWRYAHNIYMSICIKVIQCIYMQVLCINGLT